VKEKKENRRNGRTAPGFGGRKNINAKKNDKKSGTPANSEYERTVAREGLPKKNGRRCTNLRTGTVVDRKRTGRITFVHGRGRERKIGTRLGQHQIGKWAGDAKGSRGRRHQ